MQAFIWRTGPTLCPPNELGQEHAGLTVAYKEEAKRLCCVDRPEASAQLAALQVCMEWRYEVCLVEVVDTSQELRGVLARLTNLSRYGDSR